MILPVTRFRYSFICQGTSTRSNHSKVETILLTGLPKDTTKANLPDYNRPSL